MSNVQPFAAMADRKTKPSALKSFMHKRTASKGGGVLPPTTLETAFPTPLYDTRGMEPFLPQDHPHSRPLGELHHNQGSSTKTTSMRPITTGEENNPSHKKTKSTVSLKSLTTRSPDKKTIQKAERTPSPKKSTKNLTNLLTRPKSLRNLRKSDEEVSKGQPVGKENNAKVEAAQASPSRPPIYAQFSSEGYTTQPLASKFLENEIDLYTPKEYSPSKQHNFYSPTIQPTLTRGEDAKRPKSTFLPTSFSTNSIVGLRRSEDQPRKNSTDVHPRLDRQTTMPKTKTENTLSRKGVKVMAAVAAFSGISKTNPETPTIAPQIEDVDGEFEAMLDRRNIAEHQRGKMRSLTTAIKLDLVKQDRAELAAAKTPRPDTRGSDDLGDGGVASGNDNVEAKKRPRSRTFTLSKSNKGSTSPSKKSKAESSLTGHSRSRSTDSTYSIGASSTRSGISGSSSSISKAKGQSPDEFVAHLRKVQKPEEVEVGKLHKLRLLLRNETVAWTDEFIEIGGMNEIIGLLHRTMEVEWREEHEDALLHEALLCLKAIGTTELAQYHLSTIQATLFPALIHLIFDPEHKGPSEFTTRNIITSILFTYLKSAPPDLRTDRALTLLSYLRDPQPKDEEAPPPFVLEMRKDRPFRVWCKEVSSVSKEVFWIFLHNLNVIALPKTRGSSLATLEVDTSPHAYMNGNFPPELPPVPAAPYVGGVEWDATNYIASHLDLLNGIIACLPGQAERKALREQMKASGWEKLAGGTLRTCKEKFYGSVHAALRTWVKAGVEDGWAVSDVRCGPVVEAKSPTKGKNGKVESAPKIEMPKLEFDFGGDEKTGGKNVLESEGWL